MRVLSLALLDSSLFRVVGCAKNYEEITEIFSLGLSSSPKTVDFFNIFFFYKASEALEFV